MELLFIAALACMVCSVLGYLIARTPLGAVVGLLLGPLGVLVACFVPRAEAEKPARPPGDAIIGLWIAIIILALLLFFFLVA